jgi:hypothetical protein
MNFLKVTILLFLATLCAARKAEEVCAWQSNVTALVGKLTPAGQKLAAQLASDFWAIYFPGIQPVYDYIGKEMNATIQKILASSDAPKLSQVNYLIGVGNWSAGAAPRDLCQDFKSLAALVSSMSADNQKNAMELIHAVETGQKIVMPTIINIHLALDYKLYDQLKATENKDTLKALTALFSQLGN